MRELFCLLSFTCNNIKALTRILKVGVKHCLPEKVLPFNTIRTFQKVGVRFKSWSKNSKFGVNETSDYVVSVLKSFPFVLGVAHGLCYFIVTIFGPYI